MINAQEIHPRNSAHEDAAAKEARPIVLAISIKEKSALRNAFLPMFTNKGIFVPTEKDYMLGQEVYFLLSLPDSPERIPVSGKVVWVRPSSTAGGQRQGIGIQFSTESASSNIVKRIESILGADISSEKLGSATW